MKNLKSENQNQDITFKRITSLIPQKPNGEFVHGAKKEFLESIGAADNMFSEWAKCKSKSYRNYLYEISAKYDVSVAWLKGETDIKNKFALISESELDTERKELIDLYDSAPPELRAAAVAVLRARAALDKGTDTD